jgi:hypothetical protein
LIDTGKGGFGTVGTRHSHAGHVTRASGVSRVFRHIDALRVGGLPSSEGVSVGNYPDVLPFCGDYSGRVDPGGRLAYPFRSSARYW